MSPLKAINLKCAGYILYYIERESQRAIRRQKGEEDRRDNVRGREGDNKTQSKYKESRRKRVADAQCAVSANKLRKNGNRARTRVHLHSIGGGGGG